MADDTKYKKQLKQLRPYVSFNYDLRKPLSKGQKANITKYYNEFKRLTDYPQTFTYQGRNKNNIEEVKAYAGNYTLPKWKKIIVPYYGDEPPKIRFTKKKELKLKSEYINSLFIRFDKTKLIEDSENYLNKLLKSHPTFELFKAVTISAELGKTSDRNFIVPNTLMLMAKYQETFPKWLTGWNAYTFTNQKSIDAYLKAKGKAVEQVKQKRANRRRGKSYAKAKGRS